MHAAFDEPDRLDACPRAPRIHAELEPRRRAVRRPMAHVPRPARWGRHGERTTAPPRATRRDGGRGIVKEAVAVDDQRTRLLMSMSGGRAPLARRCLRLVLFGTCRSFRRSAAASSIRAADSGTAHSLFGDRRFAVGMARGAEKFIRCDRHPTVMPPGRTSPSSRDGIGIGALPAPTIRHLLRRSALTDRDPNGMASSVQLHRLLPLTPSSAHRRSGTRSRASRRSSSPSSDRSSRPSTGTDCSRPDTSRRVRSADTCD